MTAAATTTPLILHVDDNPDERLLVAEAFTELQRAYTIAVAQNGYDAITTLNAWSLRTPPMLPDLILLDVNMPRMGGLEFLAFIKQHTEWQSIPVVMLTNSPRGLERSAAAALGSHGFEIKPPSYAGYLQLVVRLEEQVPGLRHL